MAGGEDQKARTRRDYRPTLEGLESLRLLSSGGQAHAVSPASPPHEGQPEAVDPVRIEGDPAAKGVVSKATWDEALVQSRVADLLEPRVDAPAQGASEPVVQADSAAVQSGLAQLGKYLNRAWYRAGIPTQYHDDSSQAVYASLLQSMGRPRFESLVSDVGHSKVKDVFNRDTTQGLVFFRAVDMVKKRAQRERAHASLDAVDPPSAGGARDAHGALRDALHEAITQNLSAREAALIHDTLLGKTPAEIAVSWGVAPKTVSNEKSRVFQKLRDALVDHELN